MNDHKAWELIKKLNKKLEDYMATTNARLDQIVNNGDLFGGGTPGRVARWEGPRKLIDSTIVDDGLKVTLTQVAAVTAPLSVLVSEAGIIRTQTISALRTNLGIASLVNAPRVVEFPLNVQSGSEGEFAIVNHNLGTITVGVVVWRLEAGVWEIFHTQIQTINENTVIVHFISQSESLPMRVVVTAEPEEIQP